MLTNNAKRPRSGEFDPEAALRHLQGGVFPNVVTTPAPGPDITFMHGSECSAAACVLALLSMWCWLGLL